jgi:hypothetical protein
VDVDGTSGFGQGSYGSLGDGGGDTSGGVATSGPTSGNDDAPGTATDDGPKGSSGETTAGVDEPTTSGTSGATAGSSGGADTTTGQAGDASSSTGAALDDADGDGIPDGDDPFPFDPWAPVVTMPDTTYMCTATDLFWFDPVTEIIGVIDDFSGPAGVTAMADLAIDRFGVLYAISDTALYTCDPTTAQCWALADVDPGYHALGFVPPGVLDPGDDVLLAIADDGSWTRFVLDGPDVTAQPGGTLGLGYDTARDVVHVDGVGAFAAVVPDAATSMRIAHASPTTGLVMQELPPAAAAPQPQGLSTHDGMLYVFDASGAIVSVDPSDGAADVLVAIVPPWTGAASATQP